MKIELRYSLNFSSPAAGWRKLHGLFVEAVTVAEAEERWKHRSAASSIASMGFRVAPIRQEEHAIDNPVADEVSKTVCVDINTPTTGWTTRFFSWIAGIFSRHGKI